MGLTYTKGVWNNGSFSTTDATWFFENPYWNNDGSSDFVIKVQNTGNATEVLKSFIFTFLIANSGGTTFYSSSGVKHTASGNGCKMTCTITRNNIDYTAVNEIESAAPNIVDDNPGNGTAYFTPLPGPEYIFDFDNPISIEANEIVYARFKANFRGNAGADSNCIQISSQDGATTAVSYKGIIWRYNKSDNKWEKILFPHIINNGAWSDLSSIKEYDGTWKDKE